MRRTRTAVAIPAKNEAERIQQCLAALARQSVPADDIVLLLNDCTDGTAALIRAMPPMASRVHVIECSLLPLFAAAGEARRLAMDHAAALAGEGVLLTTDADGEVGPDWIEVNLAAIAMGADAVCGQAVVDHVEALFVPPHLHENSVREVAYGRLIDEIASRLDPDPADPWPRHTEEAGCSIAVTARKFRAVGGMPGLASGEDRALIRRLRLIDARIRHAPGLNVSVSGRVEGRAAGGMAEVIKRRMVQQDEFTDEQIEPAAEAIRRARTRRRVRDLWRRGGGRAGLARDLAIPQTLLDAALGAAFFGTCWDMIERASPRLARRRVAFADVTRETAIAMRFYRRMAAGITTAKAPVIPIGAEWRGPADGTSRRA
jgi:GT2 family glycosyltransferase